MPIINSEMITALSEAQGVSHEKAMAATEIIGKSEQTMRTSRKIITWSRVDARFEFQVILILIALHVWYANSSLRATKVVGAAIRGHCRT